jgi:hypothetical protein
MKTFRIADGDLILGVGGHESIEGARKLRQDLGFALLEPFGGDRFHPRWGSLMPSYVGEFIDPTVKQMIVNEVQRVLTNYMAYQQALIERDQIDGRRPRFGLGEVVAAVKEVRVTQRTDGQTLDVSVSVETLTNETVPISVTVEQ